MYVQGADVGASAPAGPAADPFDSALDPAGQVAEKLNKYSALVKKGGAFLEQCRGNPFAVFKVPSMAILRPVVAVYACVPATTADTERANGALGRRLGRFTKRMTDASVDDFMILHDFLHQPDYKLAALIGAIKEVIGDIGRVLDDAEDEDGESADDQTGADDASESDNEM